MKKILFALYLFICYNSMAEGIESNKQCIAISQSFIGQGGCKHKPSFGYSKIYYNEDDNKYLLLETDDIVSDRSIASGHYENGCFKTDDNKTISTIIVKSYINNIANDKEASFTYDLSMINIGVNLKAVQASDPCNNWINDLLGGNRNSYLLTTYLIKDVSIDIDDLPDAKKKLYVDKGDVLKLKFGKFYQNSKDSRKLQVKVNYKEGNSDWVDLKLNAGKQITSEGEIEISFDEIVKSVCGNGDSFDSKYNECTARMIEIRAVKKLLDGVSTHGNIITDCQFFQKGPDFEILEVRSPSCGGTKIKVKMKKDDLDKYSKNGFEWRIKRIDPEVNNFIPEFILNSSSNVKYDEKNGIIDLSDIKRNGNLNEKTLEEFLKGDENYPSRWTMQLAIKGNEDNDKEFQVKEFTIPKRLDPITISTTENDATINADATNPFVYLTITDDDDSRTEKRLPYNVECWDGADEYNVIYQIYSPIDAVDSEKEAKEIFNSDFKNHEGYSFEKYDSGDPEKDKEDFIKDRFYDWYDNQKSDVIKSTIKIDKGGYEKRTYNAWWEPKPRYSASFFYFIGKEIESKGETYTYLYRFDHRYDIEAEHPAYLIVFKGEVDLELYDDCTVSDRYYSVDNNGNLMINNNTTTHIIRPDKDYTIEYLGKGNSYLFVKIDTYQTGVLKIDSGPFKIRNIHNSYSSLDFTRCSLNVVGEYMIVYQNNYSGTKKVLHSDVDDNGRIKGHIYDTYHDYYPEFYSFEDADDEGFTYWVYDWNDKEYVKYYRRYEPFSKADLYEYFKTNDLINCPRDKFDGEWEPFLAERNRRWQAFIKGKNYYSIYNIPKKDNLNKTSMIQPQRAFSGKLRIIDSDQCYSNTVDYVYKYYDLSYNITVKKLPSSPEAEDGQVQLKFENGALAPYKCYYYTYDSDGNVTGKKVTVSNSFSSETNNNVITIDVGNSGKNIVFESNGVIIDRHISLPVLSCYSTPQKCKDKGGSITVKKEGQNSILTPNSILIEKDGTVISSKQLTAGLSFPITIEGIPLGCYDVIASYNTNNNVIIQKGVTVSDQSFSISTENFPAEVIDGSGKVIITAENAGGDIQFTWVDNSGNTTYTTVNSNSEMPYTKKSSGNLNITATHNNCSVTTEYLFESPKIKIVEAKITYSVDESSNTLSNGTLNITSSGDGNIDDYTFYLVDEGNLTNNIAAIKEVALCQINKSGNISFSPSSGENYYLYVVYTIKGNSEEKVKLLTSDGFKPPIIDKNCNAVADVGNPTRCYDTDGKIKLTGKDCKYLIDNEEIKNEEIDNEGKIYRPSGSYTVDIIKTSDVGLNDCCLGENKIEQTTIKTQNVTVVESPPLEYNITATNVTCYNKGDGKIAVAAINNFHGDISFAIKNGETTVCDFDESKDDIKLSPSPSYSILIRDKGCPNYIYPDKFEISQPAEELRFETVKTTDPTCWNNDGKIEVTVKGGWNEYIGVGKGYYNIVMGDDPQLKELEESSFNSTGNVTFEGLEHKDYTIYATDYGNCTIKKDGVTLYEYINPQITAADSTRVRCFGESDGSIIIKDFETDCKMVGDPLELLKVFYSNNTNQPTIESNWLDYSSKIMNLRADNYYLWLQDTNQCISDSYYYIPVTEPDKLKLSINHQNNIIREYGEKGGSVTVEIAGGNTGQFRIYLDDTVSVPKGYINRGPEETFENIFEHGTHKLYVLDHKRCIDSAITNPMIQPECKLMVEGIPHPALCNGSKGSIKINANGGWGHYSYTYNLVNDTITMKSQIDSVQVGGGLYVLTVIDAEGVMAYDTVDVPIPSDTLSADNLSRAAYCGSDGRISINISGGTAPYTIDNNFGSNPFKTMGGKTTYNETKPAGSYVVYISDSKDCKYTVPVTIVDSGIVVSINRRYPSMHQVANGRLEAVAKRGRAPYTYLWTNRNSGETCTSAVWDSVPAGTYSLVVNDNAECQTPEKIIYLATNGDLPLVIEAVGGETAFNANNGWARFSSDTAGFYKMILHGVSGVDIDVMGMVDDQLHFELTGLAPGNYSLECVLPDTTTRYADFTIAKYEPIALFVNNINHASRPNDCDGSATLQITGGVAPFIVQMLQNDISYDDTVLNGRQLIMQQLSAGIYTMIVIDKYGKRANTSFIVKEPAEPLKLHAEQIDPSCFGDNNGRIVLSATGGWDDYEYALIGDNFGRGTIYDNRIAKETYTFIAIDAKGVTDTLSVELSQPEPLRAGVAKVDSVSCFNFSDGAVTFDITGGTAPYTVILNERFKEPGNYVDSLHAGQSKFHFIDANLCNSEDDGLIVDIPQPDELVVASDSVTHTTCNTNNGKIDIAIAGGIAPYTINWLENGQTLDRLQGKTSIDSLRKMGLYSLVVVDANNCKTPKRNYRINGSSGPMITKVLTLPVLCNGDSTGTAVIDSADVIPATPYSPFRIEWPHGENTMAVSNLPAGWNEVFVIDSNNCKSSTGFNVDAPSPVEIRKIGSKDATCYGYADGRISTLTLGGVGGYHYLWNTGDTLPDLDSIAKGSYTIIATDFNNCHDTATFTIGQPDSLHVEIGEENVLMCPDNTYEFTATEGFTTYSWVLNDSVLSDKRNLIASEGGDYYLEATYGANCISRDTVIITIGDNLLEADFYMASDAAVDTALALVELSNMQIDSLYWEFNYSDFEVVDSSDYELYLKPVKLGQHSITLWAYSGGCVSYKTKQVEISQLADTTHNINLGYNPLIKSISVMPNPTRGQFSITVKLREEHDAVVMISSAGQGTPIERRDLSGKSVYDESFDLSNSSDGVYILKVVAGNEQRVAKILLTR